jgi:small subunit ribosomal protein S17
MTEDEKQDQQHDEQQAEAPENAGNEAAPEAEEGAPEAPAAEETAQEPAADETSEEPAAEAEPADEPAAEADEPADEPATEPDPGTAAPEAPAGEDEPQLGPKERRKLARSRASGEAAPQRSAADRIAERAEARRGKAAQRRRWRGKRRAKHAATAGERQAPVQAAATDAEPGKRKVRQGVVVSSKGEKTITVRVDSARRHRVYKKVVRESGRLSVHDERNEAGEGDVVRVVECRPLSRTKRWRLVEVLEKAR